MNEVNIQVFIWVKIHISHILHQMDSTREEELGLENLFHCSGNIISCDIASTYGYPAHQALEDACAMKTISPATVLSKLIEWYTAAGNLSIMKGLYFTAIYHPPQHYCTDTMAKL